MSAAISFDFTASNELVCPRCGCECTHPTEVRVNRGGRLTGVTSAGTVEGIGPRSGRGVLTEIFFVCEEGHGFVVAYQFHKGTTYLSTRPVPARDVADGEWPATIWRD